MAVDFKSAQVFHPELARALDRIPSYSYAHPEVTAARDTAQAAVVALIEAKGGAVIKKFDGTTVRLFGLRASSTTGLEGACRNWIAQLTLKSMAAQYGGAA